MAIMDLAFPLTALYMGPLALWGYFARGRRMSRKRMHMHAAGTSESDRDSWWQVSLSDSHCGAGCVLGDIVGEWIVWATAWTIGATAALGPEYILDLPLAWIFGILFQYFVIAPLRHQVGQLAPLGDAIKSDTLSVLSFEVGLFEQHGGHGERATAQLRAGPPASRASAATPVSVIVRTVVVRSGTASRRAAVFWMPMATARSTISR